MEVRRENKSYHTLGRMDVQQRAVSYRALLDFNLKALNPIFEEVLM